MLSKQDMIINSNEDLFGHIAATPLQRKSVIANLMQDVLICCSCCCIFFVLFVCFLSVRKTATDHLVVSATGEC